MSRLTEEMVIARAKQSDLSLIKKLNCWGSDLSDVSIIKRMRGVEVLALSVNKISTLSPFEDCTKLQELYLRKNNISDINEIAYLQSLPALKYLWLEENPCCDRAGANYRAIVLRALPNLKKLDNVEVTQEEVDDALRAGGSAAPEDDVYEDAYQPQQQQQQQQRASPQQMPPQQQQHSYPQHSPPSQQQQQYHHQQQQQSQQQQQQQQPHQQRRSSSPMKEPPQLASPLANHSSEATTITHSASDLYGTQTQPAQPVSNSKPPTPTKEPVHPPSPMYNTITKEQRTNYHQYDRSPGSDQESSPHMGYREVRPTPLPPSISSHSMKEYYQSERSAYPAHYRHSQTDLTEWEEHQQHQAPQVHHNPYGSQMQLHHQPQRRSAGPESGERYGYRNGSARENGGEWDSDATPRTRRPEGRFSDSTTTLAASVMNHYAGYHRRPVNRNSNLLSATLCLVKELDYASLEVLEHAVRCRIDEMAGE
ncbi:putative cyclin-dependent serine/threonine-protein kinase DDB_G0272797/DDB_G0274007 isoform X2 [Drosophila ananassae]|uniref:putative cyclin-dependent serine/threonine-protein kinase DDB_G0272797/DDB_G0274007 isoform X2 n=1 Tax=Drosophila ananassae TaxID=7217 RepID=UPI000177C51F|nr:putative cyclin-dependent serine/threonine-protein kinase DDB_G0272797/DDB_G0274007 isoform X2 [Drosophila ananassae]